MSPSLFLRGAWKALVGALVACAVTFYLGWMLSPSPKVLAPCMDLHTGNGGSVMTVTCEGDRYVRMVGDTVEVGCECG